MRNFLVVAVLALCFTGCAARVKTVTDLPAGVTQAQSQSWDKAVANLNIIADATSAARQGIIDANKAGVFPDGPQYITALQTIGKVDQLQLAASNILKGGPAQWTVANKTAVDNLINQISAQLVTLNGQGVTGIKDANTLTTIDGFIGQIVGAVNLILTL